MSMASQNPLAIWMNTYSKLLQLFLYLIIIIHYQTHCLAPLPGFKDQRFLT